MRLIDDLSHQLCGLRFVADTYPDCSFGCRYCYSSSSRSQFVSKAFSTITSLKEIDDIFLMPTHPLHSIIQKKIPLRIGFFSDPFPPQEVVQKNTYALIEKLADYKYPFIVITKSNLITSSAYIELLKKASVAVQISIARPEAEVVSFLEPHPPSCNDRLQTIRCLHDAGIKVFLRLNPLIPTFSFKGKHYSIEPILELINVIHRNCHGIILGNLSLDQGQRHRLKQQSFSALENFEQNLHLIRSTCDNLKITSTYCYLGGHLTNYFKYASAWKKVCNNCCLFPETPATCNDLTILDHWRIMKNESLMNRIAVIGRNFLIDKIL